MTQAARYSVRLSQLSYLDLIRGFVAVGRRMSVTLAAEDLHLTQSAVSRQVRSLEEALGIKLLVRGHRSISLTDEGDRLFRCADEVIKQLQDVVGTIQVSSAVRPVTISSSIGVAGLWLLPRLSHFLRDHPDIDVRISAGNELSDLRSEQFDLAVRYCPPEAISQGAIRLFGETVVPVAHPSRELTVLRTPADLEEHVLLEFDGEYRSWLRWNEWLAKQGWGDARPKGILRFNQYDQTIQAAIAGQGIALGRLELVGLAIANGQLATVSVPQPGPITSHAYWLVRASSALRPEVEAVVHWIEAEAADI
ncbi:LysR family glycine cleavage system transcriptional activator [Bradyrhizobium sp. USDA 4461]